MGSDLEGRMTGYRKMGDRIHIKFLQAARNYHDQADEAGAQKERSYLGFREEVKVGNGARKAGVLVDYLVGWGLMARAMPAVYRNRLTRNLTTWYEEHHATLEKLSSMHVPLADLRLYSYEVCSLFHSLTSLSQHAGNRPPSLGPTSAAKILHLLSPNLLAIWDARYVRDPLSLDDDAWTYFRYVMAQNALLQLVLESVVESEGGTLKTAAAWLRRAHEADWRKKDSKAYPESLLKISDETNFKPQFRDRYLKVLLA